jgi:hypothetical protein
VLEGADLGLDLGGGRGWAADRGEGVVAGADWLQLGGGLDGVVDDLAVGAGEQAEEGAELVAALREAEAAEGQLGAGLGVAGGAAEVDALLAPGLGISCEAGVDGGPGGLGVRSL